MTTAVGNVVLLPQNNQLRAMRTAIRDRSAFQRDFTVFSCRVIRLLLEAGLDFLPFEKREVTTPVGQTCDGLGFTSRVCGVSVVRAGGSMEAELPEMMPGISIGKILIQRDKQTRLPGLLYKSLPAGITEGHVLPMEPMLATAGSALAAVDSLRSSGVPEDRMILINSLASPQRLERVAREAPAVQIVTSVVEDGLNEHAFMVPGIGDFGDRFFGTLPQGSAS